MVKCLIDQKEFKNGGVLAKHLKRDHSLSMRKYYHEYITQSNEIPKCKCGCGQEMKWKQSFYTEYIKGHYSRIHNNWGHNPKAVEKSSETRRKQYASGERKVWNDGLTKETDERVKNNGIQSSIAINSNENELKRRSEDMKQNRLNGVIPTLKGSKHSQWNGGTSRLRDMIYADVRLYKEWKYPILERDNFKCVECGLGGHSHIHHDEEKMCEIIKKHLTNYNISEDMIEMFEVKRKLVDKIVDYHIQNKVSGITLCGKCHEKYHPSLNFD